VQAFSDTVPAVEGVPRRAPPKANADGRRRAGAVAAVADRDEARTDAGTVELATANRSPHPKALRSVDVTASAAPADGEPAPAGDGEGGEREDGCRVAAAATASGGTLAGR
jgi:hypothetical protein